MNRRPPLDRRAGQPHRVDAHRPLLASIRAGKIDFHALGRGHYPGDRLTPGQLPGLLSLGFWDARGDQDWGMDFHRNEGLEICLLETGAMTFTADGRPHSLQPGALTITRPWQAHRQGDPHIAAGRLHWATIAVRAQRPDQDWHWPRWILLEPKDRAELTRRLRFTSASVWRASPDIIRSFQRLAGAIGGKVDVSRISHAAVELNALLLAVLELLRAANRTEQPRLASPEHSVELFLADLRGNLTSLEQNWTLGSMARACDMGTTQFSRLCRRLVNDSPVRFLNLARLDAAARLLRTDSARNVTDIAFACGFQSSQYFAYQFQRRFGRTPTAWRTAQAGPRS